jgi:hypothetical protein
MQNKLKESKDRVASFRIAKAVDSDVEAKLVAQPVVGCDSANKFYRKLVLDYVAGRLAYKDPDDAKADPDVLDAKDALEKVPAVPPAEAQV